MVYDKYDKYDKYETLLTILSLDYSGRHCRPEGKYRSMN